MPCSTASSCRCIIISSITQSASRSARSAFTSRAPPRWSPATIGSMNARGHFAGGAATIRRPRICQNPSDISFVYRLNLAKNGSRPRLQAGLTRSHPKGNTIENWLTLGLALGLGLAFADGASAQVKLGVAGPITGGSAAFGAQLKNGVEQAVADINAAGGILGQKIQVFVGDDRADPKEGVSVANKFV